MVRSAGRLRLLLPLAALILVAWLLVEGFLWLFLPLRLDVHDRFAQSLPGLKSEVLYTMNEMELRTQSITSRKKDPGTVRILCVGASTTDQPTQSTPDIWAAVLERKLAAEFGSGVRIEVGAHGVGGQAVFDRVFWCGRHLRELEPDVVVTLEGINDLCFRGDSAGVYAGPEARLAQVARDRPQPRAAKAALQRWSQVYRRLALLKKRVAVWFAKRSGGVFEWHSKNLPDLRAQRARLPRFDASARDPDPIREFSDGIDRLLGIITEAGAAPVVLAQPVIWKEPMPPEEEAVLWMSIRTPAGPVRPPVGWMAAELDRYNEVQRAAAERRGALYVPLDRMLPKTLDVFFDDCHFTDRGNELVAEAIYPAVAQRVREAIARRGLR